MGGLKFKILFFIFIYFNFTNSSDLSIGSPCILKSGANGICQEFKDCSLIKDLFSKRLITHAHITNCNIFTMTVCCPLSLDEETTTTTLRVTTVKEKTRTTRKRPSIRPRTTTTSAPTTQQLDIQNNYDENQERISQIKCKEYGEKVVLITTFTPIIGQEPRITRTSKCTHKSVSLIVGRIGCGTRASADEFPHQALLGYTPRSTVGWYCGGSLVSLKFVLTAAHCLFDNRYGHVTKVKLGMRNKDQEHDNRKVFIYNVIETFKHPNYNVKTFNEDIGLVKLDGTVPIDEHILPICLPTMQNHDFEAIATGFGKTLEEQQSEFLIKVIVEGFDHSECRESYPEDGNVKINEETMMCYGHHKERKDTCRGDSGGPLQISNENNVNCTYTQIGISSFGPDRCGTPGFPSVYTNVFNYLDWIENIVWRDEE